MILDPAGCYKSRPKSDGTTTHTASLAACKHLSTATRINKNSTKKGKGATPTSTKAIPAIIELCYTILPVRVFSSYGHSL